MNNKELAKHIRDRIKGIDHEITIPQSNEAKCLLDGKRKAFQYVLDLLEVKEVILKMNEIRWTDKVYLDSQGNIRTTDGCPTNQMSQDLIDKVNINVGLAQPIKGEWIGNAFDEHHCNRCGHPALWEEEPDGYYEVQSRFCPNCGADMRGEEK